MSVSFYRVLIFANALVPLALLSWDWYWGRLGANPIEYFLRSTGILTLVFLLISLAVTPARKMFGWNHLIRHRRMLGLFAFFYGLVHLVTYSIFDKSFDLRAIAGDVWQRPFIAFGMAAFVILVPLAVTSTNKMVRRLGGKRWQLLHRLVYLAAIFGVVHYFMIQKSDFRLPALAAVVLAFLLGHRVYEKYLVGTGPRKAGHSGAS